MRDFIKTFGLPIVMFFVMGYATIADACGMDLPDPIEINIDIRP